MYLEKSLASPRVYGVRGECAQPPAVILMPLSWVQGWQGFLADIWVIRTLCFHESPWSAAGTGESRWQPTCVQALCHYVFNTETPFGCTHLGEHEMR